MTPPTGSRTDADRSGPSLAGKPPNRLREALGRWVSRARLRELPPLWREGRWILELSALGRDLAGEGCGLPEGRGRPVLLIPGYLASDSSLSLLSRWLRRGGYRPAAAGMRLNVDCARRAIGGLEARLEAMVGSWGERALVIGHSRGGGLGRLLASRRPDLVSGLITLGAPCLDPFGIHPLLLLNVGVVGTLGSLGVPGVLSTECWRSGPCCDDLWKELERPVSVPYLSVYSRSDGIVDFRACLDPAARHAAVDGSHLGMAVNPAVYRLIAEELRVPLHEGRSSSARARP